MIQKALAGIENALLDLKARALGVAVHKLFGGPTHESVPAYWSHCGTTRARAWEVTGTPKLALPRRRGRARPRGRGPRLRGVQDEHRRPRRGAAGAHARLRRRRRGGARRPVADIVSSGCSRRSRRGRRAAPGRWSDLNFNLEPEGVIRVRPRARAVRPSVARGRPVRPRRPRARPPQPADAGVLRREPLHRARLPAVP